MNVHEAIRDEALKRARARINEGKPVAWGWAAKYAAIADIYGRLATGCRPVECTVFTATGGTAHLPHPEYQRVKLSEAVRDRASGAAVDAVFGAPGRSDLLDDCELPPGVLA